MKPFHLTPSNRAYLIEKINKLDPTKVWEVTVRERKSKRSLEQNSRYWSLLTDLGRHLGYEAEELHDALRFKFLRQRVEIGDEALPLMKSTTKLSVEEMNEYMEAIERWAATLGWVWEEAA